MALQVAGGPLVPEKWPPKWPLNMPTDPWVVMPVLAHPAFTEAAIADVLAQTIPCRLLVINQGVDTAFRRHLERIAEEHPRVLLWSHQPCLPSLAWTWNRALECCWAAGADEALVINNDVRLAPNTLALLRAELIDSDALIVTGVGVSAKQFQPGQLVLTDRVDHGGPDFSCFLISRACHWRFPFDVQFIPAYTEDVDLHRRILLAGEGRRIYGINVPFLHYGSTTLKTVDAQTRARIERQSGEIARAHYEKKWGGPVNGERYMVPFGHAPNCVVENGSATTPHLQEAAWANDSKT